MRRLLALLFVASTAWGQTVETQRVSAEVKRVDGSSTVATYAGLTAPSGCVATSVPVFLGSPVALGCDAGLTYDAATDTLTAPYGAMGLAGVTAAATGGLATADVTGRLVSNYGQTVANTQTLPAAAAGLNAIFVVSTAGAGAVNVKAGASDKIYLDGTALDDGDKATLATPAVGNTLTCLAFQTGASAWDWICTSGGGSAWTDGGA